MATQQKAPSTPPSSDSPRPDAAPPSGPRDPLDVPIEEIERNFSDEAVGAVATREAERAEVGGEVVPDAGPSDDQPPEKTPAPAEGPELEGPEPEGGRTFSVGEMATVQSARDTFQNELEAARGELATAREEAQKAARTAELTEIDQLAGVYQEQLQQHFERGGLTPEVAREQAATVTESSKRQYVASLGLNARANILADREKQVLADSQLAAVHALARDKGVEVEQLLPFSTLVPEQQGHIANILKERDEAQTQRDAAVQAAHPGVVTTGAGGGAPNTPADVIPSDDEALVAALADGAIDADSVQGRRAMEVLRKQGAEP